MANFFSTSRNNSHSILDELWIVAVFIAVIWGVFILNSVLPFLHLERWGVEPRDLTGLVGLVTMPFLHGSYMHLVNNTIPLAVLLALMAGSRADTRWVVISLTILSGLLLWLFGRTAIHIGASALIFGLAAFLVVSGFLERRFVPLVISVVVLFVYGGTLIVGFLPWQKGVSWDGHLLGAVAGGLLAWLMVRRTT